MTNEETLESLYQLRKSMQTLDDRDISQDERARAFENLFDAYLRLDGKLSHITPLKQHIIDQISLPSDFNNISETTQRLSRLQKLFPLKGFAKDNSLNAPPLLNSVNLLAQGAVKAQQTAQQLEQLQAQKILVDQKGIDSLLKEAKKAQKSTTEKKTPDKTVAKVKSFLETAFAKKQNLPPEAVNLTRVEIQEENGIKRIVMTDSKKQSVSYRIYTSKNKEMLGNDTSTVSGMKDLYALLKGDSSFSFTESPTATVKKKEKGYTSQDFCKELDIKLTKAQAPELAKELTGYNTLLTQNPEQAEELKQKLQDKYTALILESKKQALSEELVQTTQKLSIAAEKANKMWQQAVSLVPQDMFLNLSAPASGQNKDMLPQRQQFAEFINLITPANTLAQARNKMLYSLQHDDIFWKDINQSYYKQIKICAQDTSYQALAQQMFNGKKPKEALNETLVYLSPEVAKLVLARATITYGMENANRTPDPQKTNQILDHFGFQVSLTEVPVETVRKTTSKEITLIMRCLADGHPLELDKLDRDTRARLKESEHRQELQEAFGQDKNYQLLVDNVLRHEKSQEKIEQTPYQTHNMKIGLLAALAPEMSKQIDFSEELKRSLPLEQQKKWNLDNFLFTRYMKLYFKKEISPADDENISKLKTCYDWEGFKKQQAQVSQNIYNDFAEMNKNTKTIVRNALLNGKLDDCSQHHPKPLKNAVFSSNPKLYNNTLATAVQPKLWREDPHQLHHLATVEGTDMIPPYCVKLQTKEGYTRRGQKDLHIGDKVYFESLQVKDKNGKYRDLIPENCFYISTRCGAVLEPQPTPKALDFYNQKSNKSVLEI